MTDPRSVDGNTSLYGLIGNPVRHTFSPLIHNTLAMRTGENLVYVPLGVEDPEKIGDAVRGAYALGICGMNVTVPYKQAVMPFLKSIDPAAEKIGAVNTLVRTDGGYIGCNTDYIGLKRSLLENGADVTCRGTFDRGVIIGAGGAARAAAFLLAEVLPKVVILNRTLKKAQELANAVQAVYPETEVISGRLEEAAVLAGNKGERVLAIQCTKVGLAPNTEEAPVTDPAFFEKLSFAYDVIYNPEDTQFMKLAQKAGVPNACGIGMLIFQGISAYELWTGRSITAEDADCVRQALRDFLAGR